MSFGEDQSRIRKDNAPTNVAIIRHAALNMIRKNPKKRMGVKRMRKAAGWDGSLLTEVLAQVVYEVALRGCFPFWLPNKSVKGACRPLAVLKFRFYQDPAASFRFR